MPGDWSTLYMEWPPEPRSLWRRSVGDTTDIFMAIQQIPRVHAPDVELVNLTRGTLGRFQVDRKYQPVSTEVLLRSPPP